MTNGVAEDVNSQRRKPAVTSLFAVRYPLGLEDKVSDEVLERHDEEEGACAPQRNGGT